MMHRSSIFIMGLCAGGLLLGCGKDDVIMSPMERLDGSSLLGLVNNRTLSYLQTDTVVSIDPVYSVTVTTLSQMVKISGSGSDWMIKDGDSPLINLKLTKESVIQNGYWRTVDDQDSLFYFAEPPILMTRSLASDRSWDGYTPFFETDTSSHSLLFYYASFGFHFEKQFIDSVHLLLPAGSFNAYHFDVSLFVNPSDTVPIVRISEYYAPAVGLVKLHLRGGALSRTLSLVDVS
jgi:hypothetical protein